MGSPVKPTTRSKLHIYDDLVLLGKSIKKTELNATGWTVRPLLSTRSHRHGAHLKSLIRPLHNNSPLLANPRKCDQKTDVGSDDAPSFWLIDSNAIPVHGFDIRSFAIRYQAELLDRLWIPTRLLEMA